MMPGLWPGESDLATYDSGQQTTPLTGYQELRWLHFPL